MVIRNQQSGFALMMALIVVSVVVSIGLSVLDLTLKQVRLSTNSKDSETAFHAANAGLECARYLRRTQSAPMEAGSPTSASSCFGLPVPVINPVTATLPATARIYNTEVSWGVSTAPRCSQMTMLVISSASDATTTVTNMTTRIPGYPVATKDCEPGGRCTVISVRGYSRGCTEINVRGTVQREVLLEL